MCEIRLFFFPKSAVLLRLVMTPYYLAVLLITILEVKYIKMRVYWTINHCVQSKMCLNDLCAVWVVIPLFCCGVQSNVERMAGKSG